MLADHSGESSVHKFQRFIRFTALIAPILDIVDDNRMAFNPAVAVSYLDSGQQTKLINIMEREVRLLHLPRRNG